jgi:hypothetical protein
VRRLGSALLIAAAAVAVSGTASAQDTPPLPTAPADAALIPVPAGCPEPATASVVFVGKLVARDIRTGRFELQVVRAGSAEGFSSGNLVDVRYGIDAKFLTVGQQYLVGAGVERGILMSKVRPDEPLFGGDEVVGAAEIDVECPVVEDPVRTLTVTGKSIDSGVLQPLSTERGRLLRAVLVPAGVAFAILFGLAALRWLLQGVAMGASSAVNISRVRRYRSGGPQ